MVSGGGDDGALYLKHMMVMTNLVPDSNLEGTTDYNSLTSCGAALQPVFANSLQYRKRHTMERKMFE